MYHGARPYYSGLCSRGDRSCNTLPVLANFVYTPSCPMTMLANLGKVDACTTSLGLSLGLM